MNGRGLFVTDTRQARDAVKLTLLILSAIIIKYRAKLCEQLKRNSQCKQWIVSNIQFLEFPVIWRI